MTDGRAPQSRSFTNQLGALVGERAGAIWVGVCILITLVVPIAVAGASFLQGVGSGGLGDASLSMERVRALLRTVVCAGLIGGGATTLAIPVAIVLSRARPVWLLAAATPMLLPSYLAFAGWSILRSPAHPLGFWIASLPQKGFEWAPILVGRFIAVWGLSLWVWPLAALIIAIGMRTSAAPSEDALRLDCPSLVRRTLTRLCAASSSVIAAWALCSLLMIGSAVPLHIARIPTIAINVWVTLDQHPGEPWRAWLSAWPVLILAAIAGWWISGRVAQIGTRLAALSTDEHSRRIPSKVAWASASVPWVLAALVPLGLFTYAMGSPRAITNFLSMASGALLTSLGIAGVVGAIATVTCLATAQCAASGRSHPRLRLALMVTIAWALAPGILVGSAVAAVFRLPGIPEVVVDSALPSIFAHLSRWMFLPVLIGLWTELSTPGAIRETRRLDGAADTWAWTQTSLKYALMPSIAAGLACACLSLHEIEASLHVQSPGIDSLSQRLLQWLHYEQTTELSAAAVLMLGLGVVVSSLVILIARSGRRRTEEADPR